MPDLIQRTLYTASRVSRLYNVFREFTLKIQWAIKETGARIDWVSKRTADRQYSKTLIKRCWNRDFLYVIWDVHWSFRPLSHLHLSSLVLKSKSCMDQLRLLLTRLHFHRQKVLLLGLLTQTWRTSVTSISIWWNGRVIYYNSCRV